MLLDEIDDMVESINSAQRGMERVYAIYLPHYPVEAAVIDDLNHAINLQMVNERSAPKHGTIGGAVVPVSGVIDLSHELREDADALRKELEAQEKAQAEIDQELAAKLDKARQDRLDRFKAENIRTTYRRICQMCHPDKCKRFSHIETAKLREVLNSAQDAYARKDPYDLETAYIRALYIRGEEAKLSGDMRRVVEEKHRNLELDMKATAMHKLYTVLQFHVQKRQYDAKVAFKVFVDDYIVRLKQKLGA